jgi:hypothetical protein
MLMRPRAWNLNRKGTRALSSAIEPRRAWLASAIHPTPAEHNTMTLALASIL